LLPNDCMRYAINIALGHSDADYIHLIILGSMYKQASHLF
jgi:hypothetical protein